MIQEIHISRVSDSCRISDLPQMISSLRTHPPPCRVKGHGVLTESLTAHLLVSLDSDTDPQLIILPAMSQCHLCF